MIRSAALGVDDALRKEFELPDVNEPGPPASGDELRRAGKLAALGELTPGVAHELNNPLFAVLGLLDLALADAQPGSPAHRRLTVARETAMEMRATLRTLVGFAREPADAHGPVELRDALRETVDLARRTSSASDVEIVARLGEDDVSVFGSRNELRQCVLHLLANARAAMPGGGTITVELRQEGGWATVTVADSGAGVPVGLEERIFEAFFTTQPTGSGLGLAAGRAIAKSHGGSLELRPAAGGGSSFVLRLPVARKSVRP
jgi:signal transduction histidine kinase